MHDEDPTKDQRRKRPAARERLATTAADLFYRHGIRAVGVDQIAREAGVAKVSLYRAYPSKDDLIVEYLRARDTAFWTAWDQAAARADTPDGRIEAVLTFLHDAVADPEYRGCPFANFAAEYADRGHPGHVVVEASKRDLRRRLTELCRDLGIRDADRLADALFLLIEGAFSASQTASGGVAADTLVWAAEALLASGVR